MKNRGRKVSEDITLLTKNNILKDLYISKCFEDMFELGKKLGQGAQSMVYECSDKLDGKKYAAKVIRSSEPETIQNLKQQYKILKGLDHFAITKAKYLFVNEKNSTTHMVNELHPYGTLRDFLNDQSRLTESEAASILDSLIKGVKYLHSKGVCHRDLKPENIIYDPETSTLKIIDFEIAAMKKYQKERLQMWTPTGTIFYKAPEMFQGGLYGEEVDMWAIGVIAYEMLAGEPPFADRYEARTTKKICFEEPDL